VAVAERGLYFSNFKRLIFTTLREANAANILHLTSSKNSLQREKVSSLNATLHYGDVTRNDLNKSLKMVSVFLKEMVY